MTLLCWKMPNELRMTPESRSNSRNTLSPESAYFIPTRPYDTDDEELNEPGYAVSSPLSSDVPRGIDSVDKRLRQSNLSLSILSRYKVHDGSTQRCLMYTVAIQGFESTFATHIVSRKQETRWLRHSHRQQLGFQFLSCVACEAMQSAIPKKPVCCVTAWYRPSP